MPNALRSLVLFAPLFACDVPDADESNDESEFREADLQCLAPTAPLASDPAVADVVPGELVLFQGRYYVVPGAPANWDAVLADPEDVAVLSIGDIVRVVRPIGNYKSKMIGVDSQSRLRTIKQGTVTTTSWQDSVIVVQMHECLAEVARELQECENITEDAVCCEGLEGVYAGMCAANPFYDVPNTAGQIWADGCGLEPLPTHDWVSGARFELGGLPCNFTGWVDGNKAEISNGFLTGCTASIGSPVGCQSF